MPTYQYNCTECGHFFEVFQNFSEDSLTVCPECSGQLRKVFNAVGVVFKGSGFYRTDSRGPQGSGDSGSGTAKPSESTVSPSSSGPASSGTSSAGTSASTGGSPSASTGGSSSSD